MIISVAMVHSSIVTRVQGISVYLKDRRSFGTLLSKFDNYFFLLLLCNFHLCRQLINYCSGRNYYVIKDAREFWKITEACVGNTIVRAKRSSLAGFSDIWCFDWDRCLPFWTTIVMPRASSEFRSRSGSLRILQSYYTLNFWSGSNFNLLVQPFVVKSSGTTAEKGKRHPTELNLSSPSPLPFTKISHLCLALLSLRSAVTKPDAAYF